MAENIYTSEIAEINYDKSDQFIELVWKKQVDSEEYRKIISIIVDFAKTKYMRFFLTDIRKEGLIKLEDAKWLDEKTLSGKVFKKLKKVAIVADDSLVSSIYADLVKKKLTDLPVQVQIFQDEVNAKSWLLSA